MNATISSQKRALIIRAGRLGDTVWATTAFEPVRAYLGDDTRLDIVVLRGMGKLFEHDHRIDTIFEIDHRSMPLLLSPAKLSVVYKSLKKPYDLAVLLETGSHFSSLMRFVRAKQKIYESYESHVKSQPTAQNMVHVTRKILAQGIPEKFCLDAAPSLVPPQNLIISELIGSSGDYICLHPGNSMLSRGKTALRAWPESCWRELAELIVERFPELHIVLIGEKGERPLGERVAAGLPRIINHAGKTSLQQLMSILAHSRATITTDTGPAHVAAALGTPVIAIFGPSEAPGTGPFAPGKGWAVSILKDVGCNPCVNTERAKQCIDNKCMQAVTPADVMNVLIKALERQPVEPVLHV